MFGIKIVPELHYKKDELQFALQVAGYQYSTHGIRTYQKENGLMVTGIIDLPTASKLLQYKDNNTTLIRESEYDHASGKFVVKSGTTNDALNYLSCKDNTFKEGEVIMDNNSKKIYVIANGTANEISKNMDKYEVGF